MTNIVLFVFAFMIGKYLSFKKHKKNKTEKIAIMNYTGKEIVFVHYLNYEKKKSYLKVMKDIEQGIKH